MDGLCAYMQGIHKTVVHTARSAALQGYTLILHGLSPYRSDVVRDHNGHRTDLHPAYYKELHGQEDL